MTQNGNHQGVAYQGYDQGYGHGKPIDKDRKGQGPRPFGGIYVVTGLLQETASQRINLELKDFAWLLLKMDV